MAARKRFTELAQDSIAHIYDKSKVRTTALLIEYEYKLVVDAQPIKQR
jgi:hypothetical protein